MHSPANWELPEPVRSGRIVLELAAVDKRYGDKEVFHMAWRKLDQPYAMPSRPIDALPGVMCQHDFDDKRLFQHRNMRKWSFYNNPATPGFLHENQCVKLVHCIPRQRRRRHGCGWVVHDPSSVAVPTREWQRLGRRPLRLNVFVVMAP